MKEEWATARFDTTMKVWMIPMESFNEQNLRDYGVPVTKIDRDDEDEE